MSLPGSIPFAVFLLACPAPAQSPPGGGYSIPPPQGIEWPDGLPAPGAFHDACLGSFYGDASADGAVLADTRAYLIYDVDFQASVFDVTPEGEAVAAMAAVVPEAAGDPWGLALAGGAGVWLHEEPGPAALIATGAPWNALSHLRAAKLDGAGRTDLVGGTADSVHLLHHDGSGWVSGAAFSLSGLLLDLVAVDWDGDGDDEVAALAPYGLSVFDSDGQLIDFFVGSASSGRIAAIPPMDGFAMGRLAWAFPAGPTGILLVCSPGGSRVNCGAFPAATAAIASGIFVEPSGARRVDLVTTAVNDPHLRYFLHQAPGGNPYDAGSPGVLQGALIPPYGACRIAMRDVTGDDVPDALFGRPGAGQVFFVSGAEATFAGLPYPELTLTPFVDPRMVWDEPNSELWFQTHLLLPDDYSPYTHLQVRAWRSADGILLHHQEVANLVFEIAAVAYAPDEALAGEGADMRFAVLMPDVLGPCGLLGGDGYYFTMRLVTVDPVTQHPNGGSPTVAAGFTFDQGIAEEMDQNSDGWLPLQNPGCGPSTAPALIKKPVWARLDPNTTPEFQEPSVNPPVPPLFQ